MADPLVVPSVIGPVVGTHVVFYELVKLAIRV
jgi:hypothetical protein